MTWSQNGCLVLHFLPSKNIYRETGLQRVVPLYLARHKNCCFPERVTPYDANKCPLPKIARSAASFNQTSCKKFTIKNCTRKLHEPSYHSWKRKIDEFLLLMLFRWNPVLQHSFFNFNKQFARDSIYEIFNVTQSIFHLVQYLITQLKFWTWLYFRPPRVT